MYKIFQKLPSFKGKFILGKMLIINKNFPKIFTIRNGLKFSVPNLIENVSFELFVNGIYEEKYLKIINENLPQNGVFIDVGANLGAISVFLAKTKTRYNYSCFLSFTKSF